MKRISILLIMVFACKAGFAQESMTLDSAVGYALEHSPAVLKAQQKLKDAKGQEIAAFSGFIPSIAVTGSLVDVKEELSFSGLVFQAKDTYSYGITVQQNIFTSGKLINGYGIARAGMRAAAEGYNKAVGDTTFDTTKSFYNLLLAQRMTELMEDTYKQTEQRLEQVKAYYENGLVSKLDLLRMQVQLSNLKTQLTGVKNGLVLAQEAFKMTIGKPAVTMIKPEGEFNFEEIAVDEQAALSDALKNKPDLKIMAETENITRKAKALAAGGNGPNIVGIYSSQKTKPYQFQDVWGDNWNIVVQLQWPISLAGYGRVKSAAAQLEQVRLGMDQLKQGTALEVKQICMTLSQEKENISIQNTNIGLAEESMRIADERYKSGIISSLEYMDTQIALTQSKTNYYQAIANYAIAKAQLRRATGK